MPTKKRRRARRPAIPKALRATLRKGARELNLSVDEYLRLLVAVSSHLQGTLQQMKVRDGKTLLALLENPILRTVIQSLTQSLGSLSSAEASSSKDSNTPEISGVPERRPETAPQPGAAVRPLVPYYYPYDPFVLPPEARPESPQRFEPGAKPPPISPDMMDPWYY